MANNQNNDEADLNRRISNLSPEKQALLAQRLKSKRAETARLQVIPKRADPAINQLSHAQKRMWFLSQWEPDSSLYNISSVVRIEGALDVQALQNSFSEVVRRHDVLRAHFITENGHPKQIIDPVLSLELPVVDLSAEAVDERERRLKALTLADANRPFDLVKGPLLRASLVKLAAEEHVLFLDFHHIVSDGWSVGIFIREAAMLYGTFAQNSQFSAVTIPHFASLPDLPIQYADYAEWQGHWLQGEVLQGQLDYWKNQLGGADNFLELPLDRPRPNVQTLNGAYYKFQLSNSLTNGLKQLARQEDATLYMLLLAGFEALLHRLSGQEDIRVGTPVANRNHKEVEGLIGLFVNTLVMRGDFSREMSFREFLGQTRETALGAYAHQDLPLELLLDELNVVRDLSRTPLYQVMFALQDEPLKTIDTATMRLSILEPDSGLAKFDLTLFVEEHSNGLVGAVEYNTDLFDRETIARWMEGYEILLLEAVKSPDTLVSRLPILSADERRKLILEWNDNYQVYPHRQGLAELFEDQVRLHPDAPAVQFPAPSVGQADQPGGHAQSLSYAALNEKANQLAAYLRSKGIGPNDLVGIYMERSLRMVVTTLAIIKAGGAYLPLDLSYPAERVSFILQDSQASIVLTDSNAINDFENLQVHSVNPELSFETICLDRAPYNDEIGACSSENFALVANGENLAYVMYTSGSTGAPKGVAIRQRSISRLLVNTNFIHIRPDNRIAHVSNPSFDAATFEIWGAFLLGAELIGVPREIALSSKAFSAYLREKRIDTMFLTTALFNHIAREAPDAFAEMETLIFGGEAADPNSVRLVLQNGKPEHLVNGYGPTESTTFSNTYEINVLADRVTSVPIGRPIANTQNYILDKNLQPAPVGVPGELYLGGDGLAQEYLHRPELTAEKFIANPFLPEIIAYLAESRQGREVPPILETRLYKTGDRARYLADGTVDFIGRFDFQVKLRGLRIELGEIEAALGEFPAILEPVVLLREDTPGEKRLVAYMTLKADRSLNVSELRTFLKSRIPDFMVPAAFVILEKMPITQNGKVDRRALPIPDQTRPDLDKAYIAPRTALEKYLVSVLQSVLGIDKVGIYDDFFELGGDSLKAAIFVNRLQEELNISAHVRALFMAPAVADLALYMNEYFPQAVEKIQQDYGETTVVVETSGSTSSGDPLALNVPTSNLTISTAEQFTEKLALMRRIIKPLPGRPVRPGRKNPPAVFVLSPPRSGSTLLRTMLGGNPGLFSPPELDLLSFNTLAERRAAFSGAYTFWLEGVERAVMELKSCDADQARQLMQQFELSGMTTQQFYEVFQEWIAEATPKATAGGALNATQLLVDKTPVYALDLEILKRAEEDFDQPYYLHLIRHPFASIYSFIEAKLDGVFFRYEHPFSQRELAELVWIVSHQNILEFLAGIPQERQLRLDFETMVKQPDLEMVRICEFLHLPYNPEMIKPYDGDRMTSGIRPGAQMVGDFKFYLRKDIDPKAADRWKKFHIDDTLSAEGWKLAEQLGYERPAESQAQDRQRRSDGIEQLPPILPVPRGGELPLSFAQQRLWFLDQWEPGSSYYNIPTAVRLHGQMNIIVMQQTFNEIIRRHEVLRTRFTVKDGSPVLVIDEHVEAQIALSDLQALPAADREAEARRLAIEDTRRPFDLEKSLLVRARLVQLEKDESLFILTMHHIISDGWSAGVIIREIAALYGAFAQGKPSPLPELTVQYVDYAGWQRAYVQGEIFARQMEYWKNKLNHVPEMLELPIDHPRPAVQTQHGAQRLFELPGEIFAGIKNLSQANGTTLFMTLLAAFQTLLARYSGQEDICVGTPVANRNRAEIEGLIGFFVNTLVLRGDVSPDQTFRDLLVQVKQTAIEAYDHQDIPFERLVDELQPERNQSHTPLFQVMFTLQESPIQSLKLPGLTISPVPMDSGTSKFDLILTMVDRVDVLKGVLEYNTDLFEPETIERMVGHYQTLLSAIISHPDQPLSRLDILTDGERRQLLVDWNQTFDRDVQQVLSGSTLDTLFAEQAQRTPDTLAVVIRGDQLTYRELDQRSNYLASLLRERGVGVDQIVGLCVERSIESIIGIVAVLKAGGAYLPLDPEYPADRLAYILEDAQVSILLTQRRLVDNLELPGVNDGGDRPQTELICLDEIDWAQPARLGVRVQTRPDQLAYVIYTSGSTGRPKGVLIEHRSAINLWQGLNRVIYANHEQRDKNGALLAPLRVSLNAPLPFDASVQEWLMLLSGHTLVIIPADVRQDADRLLGYIREQRIDVLDCVPSQLKMLIAAGMLDGQGWAPQAVLPGGEAIDSHTWAQLASTPDTEFYNMYGPTECTVDSTICQASRHPLRPSIGKPVVNAQAYVLDRQLQPAPTGVSGELYLGGAGVGRGYLNRPELTAERFIANPFVEYQQTAGLPVPAGDRLYKTGDLVRFLPGGFLEYAGRIDFQVKLRGFRIELGEIENVLMETAGIQEAVVLVREDDPGNKQLVAYLVADQPVETNLAAVEAQASYNISALRNQLKARLPEYMVPGVFVFLDELPLTPNRKVDRKALPKPEGLRPELAAEYQAPRTEREITLAGIWAQVLKLDKVGVRDNFFDLGGDSILSIQVVSRANQAGMRLTPRHIFEAQTVETLAAMADQTAQRPLTGVVAEQGLTQGPVELTPIQRMYFEGNPLNPNYMNQAIMLEVLRPLRPGPLQAAVEAVVTQHDALRLRFEQEAGEWKQFYDPSEIEHTLMKVQPVTVEVPRSEGLDPEEYILARINEFQASLDIGVGPLLRVVYFDLGYEKPGRLFIVLHHLAVDGISWRILVEDLLSAYQQASQGVQIELPLKTNSYQQWAARLVEYAQSKPVDAELAYWLAQARVAAERGWNRLPLDANLDENAIDAVNLESSLSSVRGVLDEAKTQALLREAPAAYNTEIGDLLLAALAQAIQEWKSEMGWPAGGRNGVQIALEGHGREDIGEIDVTRTVGWFTSVYPVNLELPGSAWAGSISPAMDFSSRDDETLGNNLMAIKEQLRQVPEKGIGYGLLRYLNPNGAELGRLPIGQLSFNYLGQVDAGAAANPSEAGFLEDAPFKLANESTGLVHDPHGKRNFVIDVIASIVKNQLRVEWQYSQNLHQPATIERLADQFLTELERLIVHCTAKERQYTTSAAGYTPSDFPEAELSQAEIEDLMDELAADDFIQEDEE